MGSDRRAAVAARGVIDAQQGIEQQAHSLPIARTTITTFKVIPGPLRRVNRCFRADGTRSEF